MTPQEFIAKWRAVELKERSASQSHFNDLCRLLDLPDPITADPKGEWFAFEKGASKTSGGEGWADVWRKDSFAWEYKGKRKDLTAAFTQLQNYAIALENPPLLIVSDMDRIRIHTNWTNTVQKVYDLTLEDLTDAAKRDILRACFTDPERLKPQKTRQVLTEEAAQRFATLAQRLRGRGHDPQEVAHFVNRLVFCMFAEDTNLLPDKMFERMIRTARPKPETFATHAKTLFAAMKSGGTVGFEAVEWFNGGLFDSDATLPLTWEDIDDLIRATTLDWSDVDPSILGTLFERGLDPDKRSQLGAHYTDRDKIMQIVRPVIVEPLMAEWAEVKARIVAELDKASASTKAVATKAKAEAQRLRIAFMERLLAFRVLDPACGSGNFLYLALLELKNIEHLVNLESEALGFPREFPRIGPEAVLGIELNPYAAELARVSVWIGEIQWMRRNGFEAARNPILRTLDTIQNRDAVLGPDGERAVWPKADVVVGNPPFLGSYLMRSNLGDTYVESLRAAYSSDIAATSDFVCFWFAQVAHLMEGGEKFGFGLVATNSIRQQQNRAVLKTLFERAYVTCVYSDEPWFLDGASVRVSIVCMSTVPPASVALDGRVVAKISPDLREVRGDVNLSIASRLADNAGSSFFGFALAGDFTVSGEQARLWLQGHNPNGRPNSDVLSPILIGKDITGRFRDDWVINFSEVVQDEAAMLYESPYEHIRKHVLPVRASNRRASRKDRWWLFGETRPGLRLRLKDIEWYICTVERAKHRFFCIRDKRFAPDNRLIVFPRQCHTTFGVLSSSFHAAWALAMGSTLEDRPGYNTKVCYDTFPFPEGLTPNIPAADYAADPRAQAIALAAARLNELRENWLNPPDLVSRVPEVVPGYPDRILPKDDKAVPILKTRTLTNLYNQRPTWLDHAHKALDQAVATAYGWGDDWREGKLTDDEILARLFRLNQERAAKQAEGKS